MNIFSAIKNFFNPIVTEVETFGKTVASDVVAWVQGEEKIVVADARTAWGKLLPILTAIPPSQYAILQGLVEKAALDAAEGDYVAIATDVLKQASEQELAFVHDLGQGLLNIIVAFLAYKPAK